MVLVIMVGVGFYAYFDLFAHHAPEDVREAIRANTNVSMDEDSGGCVLLDADHHIEQLGLVFYTGAGCARRVFPTAARNAQRANATVVIPKMGVNLSAFPK